MEVVTYIVYIDGKAPRVISVHDDIVSASLNAYNISKRPERFRLNNDEKLIRFVRNVRSEFDPVVEPGENLDNLYGLTEWGGSFSWQYT